MCKESLPTLTSMNLRPRLLRWFTWQPGGVFVRRQHLHEALCHQMKGAAVMTRRLLLLHTQHYNTPPLLGTCRQFAVCHPSRGKRCSTGDARLTLEPWHPRTRPGTLLVGHMKFETSAVRCRGGARRHPPLLWIIQRNLKKKTELHAVKKSYRKPATMWHREYIELTKRSTENTQPTSKHSMNTAIIHSARKLEKPSTSE